MNRPVRFADCVDAHGNQQGPAVIDAATITGVESRRLISGDRFPDRVDVTNFESVNVTRFLKTFQHERVVHCTEITFGQDGCIRVREPIEEVLWRLEILA